MHISTSRHFYFLIIVCKLRDRKNLQFYTCLRRTVYASKTMVEITANKDVPSAFAIPPENTEDSA